MPLSSKATNGRDLTYRQLQRVKTLKFSPDQKLNEKETAAFFDFKKQSSLHFYNGLSVLKDQYKQVVTLPVFPLIPTKLSGVILNPDRSPARDIVIEAAAPENLTTQTWGEPSTITDIHGSFQLKLASGVPLPDDGKLEMSFRGRNGTTTLQVKIPVKSFGLLDEIVLDRFLQPLPKSILASLGATLGWISDLELDQEKDSTTPPPQVEVKLGESESALIFRNDTSRDRFPYSVLIRLIEPRLNSLQNTLVTTDDDGKKISIADRNGYIAWFGGSLPDFNKSSFIDRIPIDRPLSIEEFRDDLIGDAGNGITDGSRETPMASTLGLGYIVRMAQHWTPMGLSLGNLTYSLPLAPGEQQRVAIFEQRQSSFVAESETLDVDEQQAFEQETDSSTQAVFDSSFTETVFGSSHYDTNATSTGKAAAGGIGFAMGPIVIGAGGGISKGTSSGSGNSNQTLSGARNYVSNASEDLHNSVRRQAHARRRAQRTGMRLATSIDQETAVTKVITNNNRTRALTIQYWEVLRHFDVTTSVDGVTLVCFVPLEVIQFIPTGQPIALVPNLVDSREEVLERYSQIAKYIDILRPRVPLSLRQGVDLLREYVANPEAKVAQKTDLAETIFRVVIKATVLPFEKIFVTVTTRSGRRFGPMQLTGSVPKLPDRLTNPSEAYPTTASLMSALTSLRSDTTGITELKADISLPDWLSLHEVTGIELSRSFKQFTYQLAPKEGDPAKDIVKQMATAEGMAALMKSGGIPAYIQKEVDAIINGVNLNPSQLETELGGPVVTSILASIQGQAGNIINQTDTITLPSVGYPVAAIQQAAVLKYSDLLRIEKLLQHVIRAPITYSKIVWQSLTPEERVILLEAYTIGVPSDSEVDESQDIPLLNCISNQVLGFYGNAMIMPFSIPPELASKLTGTAEDREQAPLTTGSIQDALTSFHRKAFSPPVSSVALPTRGVLAEAVLGNTPSAEKIDLTRFWNWQDSPIPQASDISPIALNQGHSNVSGLQAPSALTGIQPMITNINATPANESGELLKALIAGANTKDLPDITGSDKLAELIGKTVTTAESARADALAKATSLAGDALKAAPEVLKANAERIAAKEKADDEKAKAKDEKAKAEDEKAKTAAKEEAKAKEEKAKSEKEEKEKFDKQRYDRLIQEAPNHVAIADDLPTDEAEAYATQIIKSQTAGMPTSWLGGNLLASFLIKDSQSNNLKPGSLIFRKVILTAMQSN